MLYLGGTWLELEQQDFPNTEFLSIFSLFFQTLGPLCSPAAVTAVTGASVMLSRACHISKRTLFAFKFKKILPVAYIIAVTARLLSAPFS